MKCSLKVKSSLVAAGSNITQNSYLGSRKSHLVIIYPHLIWNDDQKCNPVKLESGQTFDI